MNTGERYEICIRGHLEQVWSEWLDGLTIQHTPDGSTLLTGPVADQASLHGILSKLRDLGVFLVSVRHIPTEGTQKLLELAV